MGQNCWFVKLVAVIRFPTILLGKRCVSYIRTQRSERLQVMKISGITPTFAPTCKSCCSLVLPHFSSNAYLLNSCVNLRPKYMSTDSKLTSLSIS